MTPVSTAHGFYEEGVTHLKRGENAEAVRALSEAIRLNPDLTNAYVGRAPAYRGLGDDAAAAEDERVAQGRGGAKPPHDGLLVLTPPIFDLGSRIDADELSTFVEAVEREVQWFFRESPPAPGADLNAACALLPGGGLLVDVQVWPAVGTVGLTERIECLKWPVVRGGPVAFVRSTTVNGGCPRRHDGFRVPFRSDLGSSAQGPLDALLMAAVNRRTPRPTRRRPLIACSECQRSGRPAQLISMFGHRRCSGGDPLRRSRRPDGHPRGPRRRLPDRRRGPAGGGPP
jgi:hypothetical protein